MKKLFKKITIYQIIGILFLIYLVVGLFALYSARTIPCGEACTPERPLIHPFFAKISTVLVIILVGPTLPILLPILKLIGIETSSGIEIIIIYFSTFVIWIFYLLILNLIYNKLIKRRKRKNESK